MKGREAIITNYIALSTGNWQGKVENGKIWNQERVWKSFKDLTWDIQAKHRTLSGGFSPEKSRKNWFKFEIAQGHRKKQRSFKIEIDFVFQVTYTLSNDDIFQTASIISGGSYWEMLEASIEDDDEIKLSRNRWTWYPMD